MRKCKLARGGIPPLMLALAAAAVCGCTAKPVPSAAPESAISTPAPAVVAVTPAPTPAPTDALVTAGPMTPAETEKPEKGMAEELILRYIQDNKLPDKQIQIGYYNTVTREEAFVNGDTYQEAASMYKVALCMYWTDKVAEGEITWEDTLYGAPLRYLLEETIVHSSNQTAYVLCDHIGTFGEYRRAVIPYYGEVPEEEEAAFCRSSTMTPRQMIHMLKLLYADSERYALILDCMSRAKPTEYFNYGPHPWSIAHKYGYLDQGPLVVNDCGVIYTQEPFLLVVMTQSLAKQQQHMSALVQLLGDYTEGRLPE